MYTIVLIIFLTLDYITPQWLNSYARAFRFIGMMDNKSFRHKFLFWNASHTQVGFSSFSVVIKEAGKFMIIFSRNKIKRMWPVLELWRIFLLNYTINTVSFCCGLTLRLHDMNISEFLEEGKTWKYNWKERQKHEFQGTIFGFDVLFRLCKPAWIKARFTSFTDFLETFTSSPIDWSLTRGWK